jgi:hypothetical protein
MAENIMNRLMEDAGIIVFPNDRNATADWNEIKTSVNPHLNINEMNILKNHLFPPQSNLG